MVAGWVKKRDSMGRDSTEVRMRRGSEFQPRRARAGSAGRLDAARRRRGLEVESGLARERGERGARGERAGVLAEVRGPSHAELDGASGAHSTALKRDE